MIAGTIVYLILININKSRFMVTRYLRVLDGDCNDDRCALTGYLKTNFCRNNHVSLILSIEIKIHRILNAITLLFFFYFATNMNRTEKYKVT